MKEKASCNRVFQIFYFPFEFCDIGIKCTSATQKAADFLKGIWTYLWHTCGNVVSYTYFIFFAGILILAGALVMRKQNIHFTVFFPILDAP